MAVSSRDEDVGRHPGQGLNGVKLERLTKPLSREGEPPAVNRFGTWHALENPSFVGWVEPRRGATHHQPRPGSTAP